MVATVWLTLGKKRKRRAERQQRASAGEQARTAGPAVPTLPIVAIRSAVSGGRRVRKTCDSAKRTGLENANLQAQSIDQ